MKATPEGVAMSALRPISAEILAVLQREKDVFKFFGNRYRTPDFSALLRREINSRLKSENAVELIEARARNGNYRNKWQLKAESRAVARILKKRGVAIRAGKRTAIGLQKMVEDITPLLLHYGVPLASGEHSILVKILRRIADEMGIPGDPRDELRRLLKLERAAYHHAAELIRRLFAENFAPPPK